MLDPLNDPQSSENADDGFLDDYLENNELLPDPREPMLRQAMLSAIPTNPDDFAETYRIAKGLDVPPAFVEFDKKKAELEYEFQKLPFGELTQKYPAIAEWMTSAEENAKLARDDLKQLQVVHEELSRGTKDVSVRNALGGGTLGDVAQGVSDFALSRVDDSRAFAGALAELPGTVLSGMSNLWESSTRTIDRTLVRLGVPPESMGGSSPWWLDPAQILDMPAEGAKGIAEAIKPPSERRDFSTDVSGALGQIVGQIGAALTLGPAATVGIGLAQGAEQQQSMIDENKGIDRENFAAEDAAIFMGSAVTAVLEKVGIDALLKRLPPEIQNRAMQILTDAGIAFGTEALQEGAEGVMQNMIAVAYYAPEHPIFDGVAYDAVVGGSAGALAQVLVDVVVPGRKAKLAERQGESLKRAFEGIQNSELMKRSPDKMREFLRTVAKNNESENVFVPVESFNQAFGDQASEMAEQLLESSEEYREAVATGGDLVVPIDRFLTQLDQDHFDALYDDIRVDEGGMSQREARENPVSMEALKEQLDEVRNGVEDSSELIFEDIRGQLVGAATTPETAEVKARMVQAFFRTMAARTGRDAKEIFDAYNLNVRREIPEVLRNRETDQVDAMLNRLRVEDLPTDDQVYGEPLIEMLRKAGGINDEGGELSARDIDAELPRGKRRLARSGDGMELDAAAELAFEKGYIKNFDINELMDALDREIAGERLITPGYDEKQGETQNELMNLQDLLDEQGVSLESSNDEIRAALGLSPEQSYDQEIVDLTTFDPNIALYQSGNTGGSGRVSTRMPTGPAVQEDYIAEDLRIELDAVKVNSGQHFKNATAKLKSGLWSPVGNKVRQYAGFKTRKRNPDAVAEDYIEHVKSNLLWLFDQTPDEIRDRSKLWYDGANKIANEWGDAYGHDADTIATVMAVLSPQRNWHHNVSGAERVLEFWKYQQDFVADGSFIDQVWDQFPPEKISKEKLRARQAEAVAEMATGKTFSELTHFAQSMMFITWDKRNNPRDTKVVTPEGGFLEESAGTVTMGGVSDYRAAFASLADPSYANRSMQLGQGNKVRSFFNNIAYPNSPDGDVTIDTHAIAAGLLQPVSSKATTVGDAFSPTKASGGSAYYAMMAEGYRRAASERGILVREMQSITWEAVRGLFTDDWKSPSKLSKIAQILDSKALEDARSEIVEYAGGIDAPAWVQSGSGRSVRDGGGTYNSSLAGGSVSGKSTGRRRTGKRDVAGRAGNRDVSGSSAERARSSQEDRSAGTSETRELYQRGNVSGSEGLLEEPYGENVGQDPQGLPGPINVSDRGPIHFRSFKPAQEAAQRYAESAGLDYQPPQTYLPPDPQTASYIADAYEALQHSPDNPEVIAAYQALADETVAQYKAMLDTGIEIEFMPVGKDAYAETPRLAILDVVENNHLYVFPTRDGFGTDESFDPSGNPLLQETEFEISGQKALVNDLFRAVHDYFGHIKDGVGFRYAGETHAWRSHSAMYSPLARQAMSSETVGQNSWVNFGPHGEHNRKSLSDQTIFADQKTALMPADIVESWTRENDTAREQETQRSKTETLLQRDTEGPRGKISIDPNRNFTIELMENADLSTFLHESGHFFLEVFADIAESDQTPDSLKADWQKTLEWMGVSDRSQIERKHHEMFAETFELYLREGKAPNPELRSMFSRFRAWLITVYKSIKDLPNAKLTDEVREVLDRLVATDDEIARRDEEIQDNRLILSPGDLGMTKRQFESYQEKAAEARQEAEERTARKVFNELSRGQKAWWKKARTDTEEEVTREVDSRPLYQLLNLLHKGTLPEGVSLPEGRKAKLDKAQIVDLMGAEFLKDLPRPYVYSQEGGLNVHVIAGQFGFGSPQEMLSSLAGAKNRKELIKAETDQRMRERFGDMLTDGTIPSMVTGAIHNEKQASVLETELKALSEQSGNKRTPRAMLQQLAAQWIENKPIYKLRPDHFLRAEKKAGKAAFSAASKGDYDTAFKEKQKEIFNHYLYRESLKAREEADKAERLAKRLMKKSAQQTLGKTNYRDAINEILERYEFKRVSVRKIEKDSALIKLVEEALEDGIDLAIPPDIIQAAGVQNYRELSLEELRGVMDTIKQIQHLSRVKNKLMDARVQKELDEVVAEIKEQLEEIPIRKVSRERKNENAVKNIAEGVFASHRKLRSMILELDGFKEDGPMWHYVMQRVNAAADSEAVMTEKATIALGEIMQTWVPRNPVPGFKHPMYRKQSIPGFPHEISKWGVVMLALNWGNDMNRQRIMDGNKYTEAQIQAAFTILNKSDWDTVQKVWDYIDQEYWPGIRDKEKRVYGLSPDKVPAAEVQTMHGTYRGGYFPLKYDPNVSAKAGEFQPMEVGEMMKRGAATRSTTKRGAAINRLEKVNMPVRLDPGVIFEHITEVIHDLTHHEMLIDTQRILKRVEQDIMDRKGPDFKENIKLAMTDIATGNAQIHTPFEMSLTHLRNGVTVAMMGMSVSTALLQPIGITQSMQKIGPKWVLRGIRRMFVNPETMESSVAWVHGKSDLMRLRSKTQNREISDIRNRLQKGGNITKVEESYFWIITRMQRLVDIPTWLGAYEKHMDGLPDDLGGDERERRAIALADQAVIDTQGGGQVKDLARIQRGSPLMKLFTNFYSYFSTLYNLTAESNKKLLMEKSPEATAKWMGDMMLLYFLPAVMAIELRELLKGEDEDEEYPEKLGRELMGMGLGTMVGLRELSAVTGGYGYSGPAGTRFFAEVGGLIVQSGQGEMDLSWWKAANNTAGILFHYPALQLQRVIEGMFEMAEKNSMDVTLMATGPRKE